MENASKALLMVAGIFFGLLIITTVLFMHGRISDYYESKETNKKTEQLATFNKQYSSYNRTDVRGSDLLSLINKIIDFNSNKDDGEEEIKIRIKIPNIDNAKLFYYQYGNLNYESNNITLIEIDKTYTHKNIKNSFLNEANSIESKYPRGVAEKLSANLSTLMGQNSLKTREQLLKQLNITSVDNNDILKYYQYQQFKRAHFDCTSLEFTKNGRVEIIRFQFNGKFE